MSQAFPSDALKDSQAGRVHRVRRPRTWLITCACLIAATAAAYAAYEFGFAEGVTYLAFLAGTVAVAFFSRAFLPTIVAACIGALIQDWRFVRPYYDLGIDHRASLLTFILFMVISVVLGTLVVRLGEEADAHDASRRRTEALFDLTGSFFYAHGLAETVDTALQSVVSLFGRSCAMYLADPFDSENTDRARRDATVNVVEGDLGEDTFNSLIEKYVVHWVFENGSRAGALTDFHEQSDIIYLPLISQTGMEGVLAVAVKGSHFTADDLEFLDAIADQIKLALERQSLAVKHRRDLRAMHATRVRSAFADLMLRDDSLSIQTVHALGDALLTVRPEYAVQREALERAVADETSRMQIMLDRVQATLSAEPQAQCDLAVEAAGVVDVLKSGLSGKVLQMVPGQSTPVIVADVPLVRLAVTLILECACGCVAKGGVVEVSVRANETDVVLVVQDNRPEELCPLDLGAFESAPAASGVGTEFVYEKKRAALLRNALLDRPRIEENDKAPIEVLLQAMCLPVEAGRSESNREAGLNRQRVMRLDRLMYGLYVAALAVYAHGGTIKQRKRLGGGVVLTMTLPRG